LGGVGGGFYQMLAPICNRCQKNIQEPEKARIANPRQRGF